jgi:hypothetical protein
LKLCSLLVKLPFLKVLGRLSFQRTGISVAGIGVANVPSTRSFLPKHLIY